MVSHAPHPASDTLTIIATRRRDTMAALGGRNAPMIRQRHHAGRSHARRPVARIAGRTIGVISQAHATGNTMSTMNPEEIVSELDKHIVGQDRAKRAVAIALRHRWRRQQVPEPLRQEITPKNILLIGPTGVGKTEIARRLARLADAPFVKVEATKFTEVGYVGRDVDTIIRDLVEVAIKQTREAEMRKVRDRAAAAAEERILDGLLPPAREMSSQIEAVEGDNATRQKFRKKLREGELNDKEIEIEVSTAHAHMEIFAPPGMEELTTQIQGMFQ